MKDKSGEEQTRYEKMTERFQCSGCVCGMDVKCGRYRLDPMTYSCAGHVIGTFGAGMGPFALGLPRGFCRAGFDIEAEDEKRVGTERYRPRHQLNMRFFAKDDTPLAWDHCNIPTWAMEHEGFLLVHTYQPRINMTWLDIIEGGRLGDVPRLEVPIDVSKFYDEID